MRKAPEPNAQANIEVDNVRCNLWTNF